MNNQELSERDDLTSSCSSSFTCTSCISNRSVIVSHLIRNNLTLPSSFSLMGVFCAESRGDGVRVDSEQQDDEQ